MSVSIPDHRRDPTGTATLRERYASKLRGGFAAINTDVREGIIQQDRFNLRGDTLAELPPEFQVASDDEKTRLFVVWLVERLEADVLELISRNDNPYVRSAYGRGLKDATRALRDQGLDVSAADVEDMFNQGVHARTLQRLFTADYEDLEDITDEVADQVRRELTEGFAQGENPRKIARRITGRVDSIGKTRATTLARTRAIDAYSEATLNRFEGAGVSRVEVRAEWLTAGDARVCPICINLEGNTWTTDEVRSETFTLTEADVRPHVDEGQSVSSFTGDWPIKPPAHPQCRCRLIPVVA